MINYEKDAVLAVAGDKEAFARLYQASYKDMYYISLKYMKNETEAEDVLQEAYIRAWKNIHTLKNPSSFPAWLSLIVANQAKNALVKKNPLLFSEMESEDGDTPTFDIADEKIETQPELHYTQQETADLVKEMVGSLSDEQRLCILMFYYENQPISAIAKTLNISENTVKSRLNYGRKNLNAKATELEKKGYKLYSCGGLVLLLLLLAKEKASAAVFQASTVSMSASTVRVITQGVYGVGNAGTASTSTAAMAGTTGTGTGSAAMAGNASAATTSAMAGTTETASGSAAMGSVTGNAAGTAAKATGTGFIHTAVGKAAIIAAAIVVASGIGAGTYVAVNNASTKPAAAIETTAASEINNHNSDISSAGSTGETKKTNQAAETTVETTTEETTTEETTPATIELSDTDYPSYISGNLTKEEFEYVLSAITDAKDFSNANESNAFYLLNSVVQTQAGIGKSLSVTQHLGINTYSRDLINRYFSAFTSFQFNNSGQLYTVDGDRIILATGASLSYDNIATINSAVVEGDVLTVNFSYEIRKYGDAPDVHETKIAILYRLEDGLYRISSIS